MTHSSVCIETVFPELSIPERIARCKQSGFSAVEFWHWHNKDMDAIRAAALRENVRVSAFCIDSADPKTATRIAQRALNDPDGEGLRRAVQESIAQAARIGTHQLIVTVGDTIPQIPETQQRQTVIRNLRRIQPYLEEAGITLLVEPIDRQERPDYLIPTVEGMISVLAQVGSESIRMLYDIFHQSVQGDFSVDGLIRALPYIGHIHVADFPGRGEPGSGTLPYTAIFDALRTHGYDRSIGFEFFPVAPMRPFGFLEQYCL